MIVIVITMVVTLIVITVTVIIAIATVFVFLIIIATMRGIFLWDTCLARLLAKLEIDGVLVAF